MSLKILSTKVTALKSKSAKLTADIAAIEKLIAAEVKAADKPKAPAKVTAKAPAKVAKKSVAKKSVAKKAPVKKPAAKKAAAKPVVPAKPAKPLIPTPVTSK